MDKLAFIPLGTVGQARVNKINTVKSPKLGTFSTIVSFLHVEDGDFGKTIANMGFIGVALTAESTDDKLKVGDMVNVRVISYRESEYPANSGNIITAAQVALLSKVKEATPARVQLAPATQP